MDKAKTAMLILKQELFVCITDATGVITQDIDDVRAKTHPLGPSEIFAPVISGLLIIAVN